jgi:hypothetical protein
MVFNSCGDSDLRRCEPEREHGDADGCEEVHDDIQAWEDAGCTEPARAQPGALDAPARRPWTRSWVRVRLVFGASCAVMPR